MKRLNRDKMIAAIRAHMEKDLEDGRVGGAGLCVMQNGEEIYKEYFGMKCQCPAQPIEGIEDGDRLIFRLASMTKPITTVATLIQVEKGLLSLDAPIDTWLSAFSDMHIGYLDNEQRIVVGDTARHKLTVRMLLSHINGLGTGQLGEWQYDHLATDEDKQDLAHMTDFWSRTVLEFHPRATQAYSPIAAFDVVARLVEITSGQPFNEFVKDHILDPCGMTDTTFTPSEEQWSRLITMHQRRFDEGMEHGISEDASVFEGCIFEDYPITWFCGGGGLVATLPDYIKFAEMLRRGGVTADGRRIISPFLLDIMGTPQIPQGLTDPTQPWGLGVRVIAVETYQLPYRTFGWSGAYGSHFWVDPEHGITAVYMKNSRYDGGSGARTSFVFEQDVYGALE